MIKLVSKILLILTLVTATGCLETSGSDSVAPSPTNPGFPSPGPGDTAKESFSPSMSFPTTMTGYQSHPIVSVGTFLNSGTKVSIYQGSQCDNLIAEYTTPTFGVSFVEFNLAIPQPGTYTFTSKSKDGLTGWYSTCSSFPLTYTLLPPPTPTLVALATGSSSSGFTAPTITVSGVPGKHTAKIYSDSACSTEVGSTLSSSSSSSLTSVNVLSTLSAPGSYTFYAKIFNESGMASRCSTQSVSYAVTTPPVPTSLAMQGPATNYDPHPTIQVFATAANNMQIKLFTDATCTTMVGSGNFYGASGTVTTSTLSLGTYTFYATLSSGGLSSACSSASFTYELKALPPPTSLSLVTPAASPHYSSTPTVLFGGLEFGDAVYVYTDNACTQQIASGDKYSDPLSLKINFILPLGVTNFYTKRKNSSDHMSACSSSLLSYTRNTRLTLDMSTEYTISGQLTDSAILADLDQNSFADMIIGTSSNGFLSFISGYSGGTFGSMSSITNQSATTGIVEGDFNRDGRSDIATVSSNVSGASFLKIFLGNGNGTVQNPSTISLGSKQVYEIATADFNNDGILDLAFTMQTSLQIYLGVGNGTFQTPISYTLPYRSEHIAIADLNGDSKPDIVVAEFNTSKVEIFMGIGNGTFAAPVGYAIGYAPQKVVISDMNEDGFPDIVVLSGAEINILINNGSGSFPTKNNFVTSTLLQQQGLVIGDMDGDGHNDIVIGSNNMGTPRLQIYFGLGNGLLAPNLDIAVHSSISNILIKDIDHNGKLDLVVIESRKAEVYLNQ